MSGTTATARRLPSRTATTRSRPRLIVLASPRSAGKAPFVALVGGLLLAGLLSLLMLHTLAAQDAFRQTSLQQRLANLTDSEQRLEQQVQLDSAPASLRAKARALGMVPSVVTHYRQLSNGRTVAREVPATTVVATTVAATTSNDTKHANTANPEKTAKSDDTEPIATDATTTDAHQPHGAAQR
ncbi:MAG TPA: hypothetical protein VHD58_10105 [Mycobacteriales bacterium]|nr:hypothetical protein [Mycobacteriales bacterium]